MTRRWKYAKSKFDEAVGKHAKRSGWQSMMRLEVVKSLRRLPRKRRAA